jgi:long-chain acyl-CoA synthetase
MESIGLPVHNTQQKIVDLETGERELSVGEDGELIIRGPQVMQGYWKAPEETAQVLRNGWLFTGDVGHIDTDGYAYLVDRKKDMIKYKGFGVAPAELEALLREHPAIMDAAVIGIPDEKAGERIKGFVVLRQGYSVSPEEILGFANKQLASYKHLHYIECLDALPQTTSGKILMRELKAREQVLRQKRLGQSDREIHHQ